MDQSKMKKLFLFFFAYFLFVSALSDDRCRFVIGIEVTPFPTRYKTNNVSRRKRLVVTRGKINAREKKRTLLFCRQFSLFLNSTVTFPMT